MHWNYCIQVFLDNFAGILKWKKIVSWKSLRLLIWDWVILSLWLHFHYQLFFYLMDVEYKQYEPLSEKSYVTRFKPISSLSMHWYTLACHLVLERGKQWENPCIEKTQPSVLVVSGLNSSWEARYRFETIRKTTLYYWGKLVKQFCIDRNGTGSALVIKLLYSESPIRWFLSGLTSRFLL